ncbi:MAG: hypothetical protein ACR2J3_12630 [Aridibacter sp.]
MKKDKKFILEITEEDYQEGLKKGWTDDDMLPVGKHEFRRATRFRNKPKEIKIKLKAEILDFLQKRSDESIENQINKELRKIMEEETLKVA